MGTWYCAMLASARHLPWGPGTQAPGLRGLTITDAAPLCLSAPPADAINIMLHVQHRPGAQPGAPRHGYQTTEGMQPSYGGAGGRSALLCRACTRTSSSLLGTPPACLLHAMRCGAVTA